MNTCLAANKLLSLHSKKTKRAGDVAQVIECFCSKNEAPSSNPSIEERKKERKRREEKKKERKRKEKAEERKPQDPITKDTVLCWAQLSLHISGELYPFYPCN
jgi:hypothetical protein